MNTNQNEENKPSQRGLKNRHIQLIAIAGTIGTGLFLGAGKSIHLTGPSIIFVYLIIGALMYILLRAIGEMLYQDPNQHSFLNFVSRYLGEKPGYFIQWSYLLVVVFVAMAELIAIGTYINFWLPDLPIWMTEVFVLVLLTLLNTLNPKFFGETEFWFGMIKIVAIIGLILTAIILIFSHYHTGTDTVSVTNITKGFEFFPNGLSNFFESFQMVMFAFVSMEFIGMTAAETDNPRPTLKKAINQIPIRIVLFYVGALLAIMSIYQWRDIPADKSPFVTIFQLIIPRLWYQISLALMLKWEMSGRWVLCSLLSCSLKTAGMGKGREDGILNAFKMKEFSVGPLGLSQWHLPAGLSDNLAPHSLP